MEPGVVPSTPPAVFGLGETPQGAKDRVFFDRSHNSTSTCERGFDPTGPYLVAWPVGEPVAKPTFSRVRRTPMKKTLTAITLTGASLLGTVSPALAAPATTSALWNYGCTEVTVESTKDISNLVYRLDGVVTKIEFKDGTHSHTLPGGVTDVWIKSGNNKSGDGPGYGEHHGMPADCSGWYEAL